MPIRLMRLLNRKVGKTEYWRYRIGDLPEDLVEQTGWKDKDELRAEVQFEGRRRRLVIWRED